jgi:hypothetical protein
MSKLALRGKLPNEMEEYKTSDEYKGQGDTRKVKALSFRYFAETEDASGNKMLHSVEVARDQEVTADQIGSIALAMGEREGLFYTDKELKGPSTSSADSGEAFDPASAGEFELAEWLKNDKPTINEVLEVVNDDKDLAHRMLQAENIATEGDPRSGLEAGLTSIIEG